MMKTLILCSLFAVAFTRPTSSTALVPHYVFPMVAALSATLPIQGNISVPPRTGLAHETPGDMPVPDIPHYEHPHREHRAAAEIPNVSSKFMYEKRPKKTHHQNVSYRGKSTGKPAIKQPRNKE